MQETLSRDIDQEFTTPQIDINNASVPSSHPSTLEEQ